MKLYIWPTFSGKDEGDGGVRRVVEAQREELPKLGIEIVDSMEEADVVAAHISAPRQVLNTDKPLVAHCHGLYWSEYEWPNWALQANREVLDLCKRADAITAPSEWVADNLRRNLMRPATSIPHGVRIPRGQIPDKDEPYVLWNKTRPDPVCDPGPLDELAARMPDMMFVSTFGKDAANVEITGRLPYDEALEKLKRASAYLATTRETFGIGTLEALAYGVPVVGYDFGGQHEIITHKEDGYLVPPGDIDGLKAGVEWAVREADPRRCRETAKQFSWQRAAREYVRVYQEAYDSRQSSSPRTSIIVTAYNLEQYLPEALDSVIEQSDTDWECLVVDDASPDRCGEIIDEYAKRDARIVPIHNERNLYLAGARNRALERARGRYVLALDADDKLPPDAVSLLADSLDADRSLHIAYGRVYFIEEDGQPSNYGEGPGRSRWPIQWNPAHQMDGNNLLPYSSMIRTSALRSLGGWRRRLLTSEDADLWTRSAAYGYRAEMVTKKDSLIYRNRSASMSRDNAERRSDYLHWYSWHRKQMWLPAGVTGKPSLLHPRVAVIIACSEAHRTLVQDAVDSVLAQTDPRCVPVVAGRGERPTSLPAAAIWMQSEGDDPAHHRNLAAEWAFRNLPITHVLPLDADDYLQLNAIEEWLAAASKFPNEILYSDFWQDVTAPGVFTAYEVPDYDAVRLIRKGAIHAVTALIPRAEWYRVGGFTEADLGWEDWDLQLKLAEAGVCSRRIAEPLFYYRKHSGTRRNYSAEEFERRKHQIRERFAAYFDGREQLMACGCKGKTVKSQSSASSSTATLNVESTNTTRKIRRSDPANDDAVLVQYTGNQSAPVRFRGKSGVTYTFSKNNAEKYIAAVDQETFRGHKDFRILYGDPSKTELELA